MPAAGDAGRAPSCAPLSPGDNPLVRAVGRVPAKVHTKLLVAFVATALLVVAVGVLGAAPPRAVERAGGDPSATLQERSAAYSELRSDAGHVRLLLSGNLGRGLRPDLPGSPIETRVATGAVARRPGGRDALDTLRASTRPENLGFVPPAEDEQFLRQDPATTSTDLSSGHAARIVAAGKAATRSRGRRSPGRRGRSPSDLRRARHPSSPTRRRRRRTTLIAQNASAYASSRNLFIGVRGRGDRPRAAAGVRPLVVADRADPADRRPAGRDRLGRLLRARRRHEPRRAGRARREREPDERRAQAPVPGARDGEPAQVGVPRQHVARAADAAERDHRLLAGAARGDGRRGEREAGGVPRRHPLLGEPPALADQRRARPVQGRGGAGRARGRAVLAAGRARERRRDGARAGDDGRRPDHARGRAGRRRRRRATSGGSGRSSSTCSRTR